MLMDGAPLKASDANYINSKLNQMLSSWSVSLVSIYAVETTTTSALPNIGEFTIGPTGDVVVSARPLNFQVIQVQFPGSFPVGSSLVQLSPGDFQSLSIPTLQGVPAYYSYNPTIPNGTINIYPVPTQNFPLKMTYNLPLSNASLNSQYSVPPGYEMAIISNLACLVCVYYGLPTGPELLNIATSSKRIIDVANQAALSKNPTGDMSAPGMGHGTTPVVWFSIPS
jgi:hypothetical protein